VIEHANALFALAAIVLAGAIGGQLAQRIRLPHVTGQILIGVLIGSSGLNLFGHDAVASLGTVTEFALGMIALTIGEHLSIRTLRNAGKRLFVLLLTESLLTPIIVFVLAYLITRSPWLPLLLAAMSISTAPATVIALVKETRSKGIFVKTLSAAVALNNIACIGLFAVARTFAGAGLHPESGGEIAATLLAPLLQIVESIALGGVAGLLLILATRKVVRSDRLAGATVVTLLLVCGLAIDFNLSLLLSCLSLGFTLANLTPQRKELGGSAFENIENVIFAAFFTLAGMELHLNNIAAAGLLAVVVLVGRFGGKLLSGYLAMRIAGATAPVRRYLGLALIPQAGVAVGLILLVQQDSGLSQLHNVILTVGLTTVMINELIGSITTSIALRRSGDAGKDRPRLIDFIQEENIITNMTAKTKEEAIEQLTDELIASNHLSADRDEFLATVLERESEASTCVGSGLAIPHGIIKDGKRMFGAMGISKEGLSFETPDGRPIHCMVLLATPESERERHLEVIAALARAIGRDHNIQEQLFNAETPAHAFEVLHAEEAEDFNYYLSE